MRPSVDSWIRARLIDGRLLLRALFCRADRWHGTQTLSSVSETCGERASLEYLFSNRTAHARACWAGVAVPRYRLRLHTQTGQA